LASLIGAAIGAAAGVPMEDDDAFFPPEMMLAIAGAIVTIPIGSTFGVLTDPRAVRTSRPVLWTLGGTAAGFAAGALLAPVTVGFSFFFATPLGTAMGYRHGTR
jgi:hypothetical protein